MFWWIFDRPYRYIITITLLILGIGLQMVKGHFGNCLFITAILFTSVYLGRVTWMLMIIPLIVTYTNEAHLGLQNLLLKMMILTFVMSVAYIAGVTIKNRVREIQRLNNEMLLAFINAIEAKSKYLKGHSKNVAFYADKIAASLKMNEKERARLYRAALLHDIGKIGVGEAILEKEGALLEQEWDEIKQHPITGCKIVERVCSLNGVLPAIRYHHQHYNGKGYPGNVEGDDIPLFARIICIADSFDAMTSDRVYRPKMTIEQAVEELERNAGIQFDPELVRVFVDCIKTRDCLNENLDDQEDGQFKQPEFLLKEVF